MVQPLLENAIKHGLSGIPYHGELNLRVSSLNQMLLFEVIDNGHGLPQKDAFSIQEGHALTILNDRINLLNIEWPDKQASISLKNRSEKDVGETGVYVRLILPKLPHNQESF